MRLCESGHLFGLLKSDTAELIRVHSSIAIKTNMVSPTP
jgi:hypothetical protein